jgi:pilus assembly protein CpaC
MRRAILSLLLLAVVAAGAPSIEAGGQQPAQPAQAAQPGQAAPATDRVELTAGRSTVLTTDFEITRIAVTNPAIADATVVQTREILIDGKAAGTVSLIVWGTTERRQYDLVVEPSVTGIQQRLQTLFPGEDVQVTSNDEALILSGKVSSNTISLRMAEIVAATSSKVKVINLLQYPGANESQQVLLQVRFAEVSRTAGKELGASFFTGTANNNVGRLTAGTAAPNVTDTNTSPTFSDLLNIFLYNKEYDIGTIIRALQSKGLFQSLAEPNLIAYNGQEASFLAGGEIPVPTVSGNLGQVTISYKEFGIRLNFTPTIAGDTIRIKVRPEVSTLDFPNGVTLAGFRIPALSVRRAETDVELRDGQSFAIAGLLNNLSQDNLDQIPYIASIPIIGTLFKHKTTSATRNELMVLITPRLVRPLNPDEVPPLPTLEDRFLPSVDDVSKDLKGGAGAVDAPDASSSAGGEKKK